MVAEAQVINVRQHWQLEKQKEHQYNWNLVLVQPLAIYTNHQTTYLQLQLRRMNHYDIMDRISDSRGFEAHQTVSGPHPA